MKGVNLEVNAYLLYNYYSLKKINNNIFVKKIELCFTQYITF